MTAVLERPLSEPTPDEPDNPTTPEVHTTGRLIMPGNTTLRWDTRDKASVVTAKTAFDTLVAEGGLTYKTEGADSEVIHTFDPSAQTIIAARPMAGG